jgi:hypothetical protein
MDAYIHACMNPPVSAYLPSNMCMRDRICASSLLAYPCMYRLHMLTHSYTYTHNYTHIHNTMHAHTHTCRDLSFSSTSTACCRTAMHTCQHSTQNVCKDRSQESDRFDTARRPGASPNACEFEQTRQKIGLMTVRVISTWRGPKRL